MNNHDLNRVLFWKTGNAKKCINFYTLDLGYDVIKRHLLEQLLKPRNNDFYPATLVEHPKNNHDPDRVLFSKSCNGHLGMTRKFT